MDNDHLSRTAWVATRPADVAAIARDTLTSPALSALVGHLGGPVIRDVPDDLEAFLEWSRHALDTRGGAERDQAPAARFSASAYALFLAAARELGMLTTPAPALGEYDLTAILGGTVIGNHLRVTLTADLDRRGTALGTLVGLTAHRPLTAQEQARAEAEAETSEWQNLLREMTEAFGPPAPRPPATADPPATFQAALDREFATRDGGAFRILVAPSPEPGRRANTGDSVTYLARQVPPAARRRVLLVTSAIYAPYQFFLSAPRLLAAGTRHVEPSSAAPPRPPPTSPCSPSE